MILAGIDIGTLTCRLLIAKLASDGQLTPLHADRRMLRLGEGVDRHRTLTLAAMARVLETLREWKETIAGYSVDRQIVVATSAVRDAYNRNEFLARVNGETGFAVEILSGEEEARRTMLGIRSGLPPGVSDVLGLDIGGGSTEYILDRRGHAPIMRSFDIGVIRLTERYLAHDPPTANEVASAQTMIRASTAAIQPWLRHPDRLTLVGTAGTVTTLAAMAQRLPAYDHAHIHNFRLSLNVVSELERQLLAKTRADRRGMPGLETGREDVIVAGAMILSTVMRTLDVTECLVSDYGLREGILLVLTASCENE